MSRNGYTKLVETPEHTQEDDFYSTPDLNSDESRNKGRSSNRISSGISAEGSRLLAQPQNVQSNKVYVFSDGTVADTEYHDEAMELNQLTTRKNHSQRTSQPSYKSTSTTKYDDIITKEIPLHKTDTLQSLSIKFRCSIADLKRINGLYTDQEFYALTSIKIPVRSHQGLLQEELEKVANDRAGADSELVTTKPRFPADIVSSETSDEEGAAAGPAHRSGSSLMDMVELHSDPEDQEAYALLDRGWSSQPTKCLNDSKREKKKFDKMLHRKDEAIRTLTEKVQRQTDNAEEITSSFMEPSIMMPPRPKSCLNNMTLSLPCLIVSCLIILFGVPCVIYYYYFVHLHPENGH